jgi:HK97 gp10 family phage protein
MAGVYIKMVGSAELKRTLDELKQGSRNKVMRNPLKAGATVIRKEAKRRAPKLTGALGDAIHSKVTTAKKKTGGGLVAVIGVLYNAEKRGKIPNYYAFRIEKGHDHRQKNAKPNRQYRKWARAAVAAHAGTSNGGANPFLSGAMDAKKGEAFAKIRSKVVNSLATEVARLERKNRVKAGQR